MKYKKFECLGDKYPRSLEENFDRILLKIDQMWDTKEIDDYFSDLVIDKRGGRQGFSKDVMDDILTLKDFRESETLRRAESKEDAIHILESLGITHDKDAFLKAIIEGNKTLVDLFVRSSFNIHVEDDQGTPAVLIALRMGYTVIAEILLNAGSDINAKDRMGITPLMLACGKSTQSYVRISENLINKGAYINVHDKLGYTPLLLSLSGGASEVADLLIEKGADIYAQTKNGENALSLAEKSGNKKTADLLRIKHALNPKFLI